MPACQGARSEPRWPALLGISAHLPGTSALCARSLQPAGGPLPKCFLSLDAEKPSVVDLIIKFPTDENVKRKWVLAMKRLDVNAAGFWEPKKGDVLCSRHFKKTDFDRSAPNIKLKPGVVPSIFDFPPHLQGKREQLPCRKHFILKTLPVTNHNHKLVGASTCIEEFRSQFIFEHSYSVMDSPKKLKYKLDHVISELEDTKKSLRNVLDREKRFQKSLGKTIRELKEECLINQETANRLEAFCWEYCQESIE